MRLVKYKLEMVKEASCNYGGKDYIIKNPWDIYKALIDVYKIDREPEEVFLCVCLDTKGKIIGIHEVARGTLNSALIAPREVFKRALVNNASRIIIVHNHPSGNPDTSKEDENTTSRLVESGEILGVEVLDHLVIGDGTYFSFKENNIL